MPSLAERHEDLGLLIDELLVRIAHEHRILALPASSGLHAELGAREWRGNVRQLRHTVEGALIRANAETAPQVEARHVQDAAATSQQQPTFHEATRLYQRELLRRELLAHHWSVATVAERLDLTRSHIYNLINQFGLRREDD
jgi:Nif-specific regulatory protein